MLGNRRTYIGGSDAPIIMGVSPFKKRQDLLLEKLGIKEPFRGNPATRFGQEKEETLALNYEFEKGCEISNRQEELRGNINGFALIGHIDGRINGKGLIDFKTTSETKRSDWENGVPAYYYYQALFYMMLDNSKEFTFYVGFVQKTDECGNKLPIADWRISEYQEHTCEFNKKDCELMKTEIHQFVEDLKNENTGLTSELKVLDEPTQIKLYKDLCLLEDINNYQKQLKEQILTEMENNGISNLKNKYFDISYIAETTRKGGIDEKKLISDGIDIKKYRKAATKVKSSIRIKLVE